MNSKIKVTDNFSGWGRRGRGSPSKIIQLFQFLSFSFIFCSRVLN